VSGPEASDPPAGALAPALELVRGRLAGRAPRVAIVLGSGLGGLADRIADPVRISYAEIPGFHVPTVEGHKGELVAGTLGGGTGASSGASDRPWSSATTPIR